MQGFGLGQLQAELPSSTFQFLFKQTASGDVGLLNTFLNNLLNYLNTTISEASVIVKDVSALFHAPTTNSWQATRVTATDLRKANFLCELSINLLRVIMIVQSYFVFIN